MSLDRFRVRPGKRVRLADHDPAWVPKELRGLDKEAVREREKRRLDKRIADLRTLQGVLWSSDVYRSSSSSRAWMPPARTGSSST